MPVKTKKKTAAKKKVKAKKLLELLIEKFGEGNLKAQEGIFTLPAELEFELHKVKGVKTFDVRVRAWAKDESTKQEVFVKLNIEQKSLRRKTIEE